MIFTAIKLASRVATVVWVAKTGYELMENGKKVYGKYQKTKAVKQKVGKVINSIKGIKK